MKIGGLDIGPAHAARIHISIVCWMAGLKEISTKPESQDGKPGCNIARESVPCGAGGQELKRNKEVRSPCWYQLVVCCSSPQK